MPLQTQILPISFYKGIDTFTDPKNSLPGDLEVLENGVFEETGKISKRNGFEAMTVAATSGNISHGSALCSFNNELIEFTGNDVLGFSEAENLWLGRGKDYSLSDKTKPIYSDYVQQQNAECKVLNNLELYVWEVYPGGGIRYSVVDHLNGSKLVSNAIVDVYGSRPKVITFQRKFLIIYYNHNQLFVRTISPSGPFYISDSTRLISGMGTPQYDVLGDPSDLWFWVGWNNIETTILTYFDAATEANGTHNYFVHNSTGAINVWQDDLNNIWVMGASRADFTDSILCCAGIVNKSALDPVVVSDGFTICKMGTNQQIYRICGFRGVLSGENTIYYEVSPLTADNKNQEFDFGNFINKAIITTDGQIFHNAMFQRGAGLYSKPFKYDTSNFVLITTNSTLQSTYYLIDEHGKVVSRSNVNNGGGYKADGLDGSPLNVCTDSVVIDPVKGVFIIPLQVKTELRSDDNRVYLPTGINSVTYNFSDQSFSNVMLGNNLNISGGVTKTYDGCNLVENNFFQFPEDGFGNTQVFTLYLSQSPSPTQPQIVQVNAFPAYRIKQSSYFLISTLNNNYYVWFNLDAKGSDPSVVGRIGIQVNITSIDSALTVDNKLSAALDASGEFTTEVFDYGIVITNTIVGAGFIASPDAGTMNSTDMLGGTYLYQVTYESIDALGQPVKGAPSVPFSVTSEGTVSIVIPTNRITEKDNVNIVVYRTEDKGDSVFYRVSDLINPIKNNKKVDYVTFIDTKSDQEILANDVLYTFGGVVENASPPSSTMSCLYKNRMFLGGLEDGNVLWFSKTNIVGRPVEFSELLTFRCGSQFGVVTALGVLDDKVIIFKEEGIFYLAGNGPDPTVAANDFDTGYNNISTDVGCKEPKSVILMPLGLMFKSKKGIYLLDRGLNTTYIGAPVADYNDLVISSAVVNPINNQVRFTTFSGTMLVYDYEKRQWSTFTNLPSNDATYLNSSYYLLKPNGVVYKENPNIYTDDGAFIQLRLKTGWMSFAKLQGFQRIRRALILGSYIGKHKLNLSFAYDFSDNPTQFSMIDAGTLIGDHEPWGSADFWGNPVPGVWGGDPVPYEFNVHLTQQKCTSFRIEIFDSQESNFNRGFDISNIAFEVGVKQGSNKLGSNNKVGNST